MSAPEHTADHEPVVPPLWLHRDIVRALLALAEVVPPLDVTPQDLEAARSRALIALDQGVADIPLARADCVTLFETFADMHPADQARAADSAALFLGQGWTADDIADNIRSLGAAAEHWLHSRRTA